MLLGGQAIPSFGDNTREAEIAAQLYNTLFMDLLAKHTWQFNTNTIQIPQLDITPADPRWQYAYQLPADRLVILNAMDSSGDDLTYVIEGDVLYSNSTTAVLKYQNIVIESQCPYFFINALVEYCAWKFAKPLRDSDTLAQDWEKSFDISFQKARTSDGKQNTPKPLFSPRNSRWAKSRYGMPIGTLSGGIVVDE